MAQKPHCPRCDDFGRVETKYGLIACPEPRHRDQVSLCPWDGPTAGEAVEERCRAEEAAEKSQKVRKKWSR
jgi:hypothetical protein